MPQSKIEKLKAGDVNPETKEEYTLDEIKSYNQGIDTMQSIAKAETVGLITAEQAKAQLDAAIAPLANENAQLKAKLEEHYNMIIEAGTMAKHAGTKYATIGKEVKSIEEQLTEQITAKQADFDQFLKNKSGTFELNIDISKAAGTITTGNIDSKPNIVSTEVVPGLVDILGYEPIIIANCDTAETTSSTIIYPEKKNRDGTTIFIAEGASRIAIDFDIVKGTSTAKIVGDYIKVSEKMVRDVKFIASEIRNELIYQVYKAADNGVLTGSGTGDNLSGITTNASAYTLTTILEASPNGLDCLRAAATQIKTQNAMATHAFVNPIDYTNMKIRKGTTGYYVLVNGELEQLPFQVIESNQIAVGDFLVADMRKAKVRIYQNLNIKMAYDQDDFTKGNVTFRGEMELHFYIPSNHTAAFVYDQYNDVAALLTA